MVPGTTHIVAHPVHHFKECSSGCSAKLDVADRIAGHDVACVDKKSQRLYGPHAINPESKLFEPSNHRLGGAPHPDRFMRDETRMHVVCMENRDGFWLGEGREGPDKRRKEQKCPKSSSGTD